MKRLFISIIAVMFLFGFVIAPTVMAHESHNHGNGHGYDQGPGNGPGNGNGYGHQRDRNRDCNDCEENVEFSGIAEQTNGIFKLNGFAIEGLDGVTVIDGALVVGSNTSSGEFEGVSDDWGLGGAGTFGATKGFVHHDWDHNFAAGITGNVAASGFGGEDCVNGSAIASGSGELTTLAVTTRLNMGEVSSDVAQASSYGSFTYNSQTNNENTIVIGGGLTAGFSYSTQTFNSATAAAGAVTFSGGGSIPYNGYGE